MARVKTGNVRRKRRKRMLKHSKGYRGGRNNLRRTATEAVEKGWNHAYAHRRARKRDFRQLWIARINAAAEIARTLLQSIHTWTQNRWRRTGS